MLLLVAVTPLERADHLINTPLLATAHGTAATQGQSYTPTLAEEVESHFTAFVPVRSWKNAGASNGNATGAEEMRIVELGGSNREAPIDRGPCHNFLEVRLAWNTA